MGGWKDRAESKYSISMSNSTGNCYSGLRYEAKLSAISVALRVLFIPNSTGYLCYHSLIVGQLFKKSFAIVATLYRSLTISLFED